MAGVTSSVELVYWIPFCVWGVSEVQTGVVMCAFSMVMGVLAVAVGV